MSDIDISTNPSLEESVVGYLKDVEKTKEVNYDVTFWKIILKVLKIATKF